MPRCKCAHDETPFIAGPAIESLTKAIVAAQGVDVDVVAGGATVTSKAVLAAAEQALQKASTLSKTEFTQAARPDLTVRLKWKSRSRVERLLR